ncbi:GrpB family protein [Silvimonas soli]|uniref:GrpB family protein n=1 Tax=Silvimonas soli TaxID=2980100 RepID=UPI0024B37CDD|nr:GrpB family protein [Silvimonas soli]
MTPEESLHQAINQQVALVPYDPNWPLLFAREQERLSQLFGPVFLDIQHIGSTAIPNMLAKPVIDILAGVEPMPVAVGLNGPLCNAGYTTSAQFNASLTDRQWFMRWSEGVRTHHLHVVVYSSTQWQERLQFRDTLRHDPQLAAQYAALKTQLAQQFGDDREAYTDAKGEFVRTVLGS